MPLYETPVSEQTSDWRFKSFIFTVSTEHDQKSLLV